MLLIPGRCRGNSILAENPGGLAVDAYLVPVFPIFMEALLPSMLGPILQGHEKGIALSAVVNGLYECRCSIDTSIRFDQKCRVLQVQDSEENTPKSSRREGQR